ncbi:MAG: hypothetical protein J0L82_08720 [Deltaproteobacteria bacterium]|nr:hypothetical protein [Deltaproteobacteria bacterium]
MQLGFACSIIFVFFFGLMRSAWATEPDYRAAVDRAYLSTMKQYFQDISKSSQKNPELYDFVSKTFHMGDSRDLDLVKGVRTPQVRLFDGGLSFRFSATTVLRMRLGAFGEVIIDERPDRKTALLFQRQPTNFHGLHSSLVSGFFYELLTVPPAEAFWPVAGRLAMGAFRLIAGNSVRVTAAGAGAGAAAGCYAGASMKYDYESYAQGCGGGALDGALILSGVASIPYFNDRGEALLSKTAVLSPKVGNFLKAFGVVGSIAAVLHSAPALATMNGSILRCSGSKGDFILSAKTQGATRFTLYESFGEHVELYGENGSLGQVEPTEKAFFSFLKGRDHFKSLTDEQVVQVAKKMVADLEANRRTCLKLGDGKSVSQSFDVQRRTLEEIRKTSPKSTAK